MRSSLPSFQVLFVSCYVCENMHYPCVGVCACVYVQLCQIYGGLTMWKCQRVFYFIATEAWSLSSLLTSFFSLWENSVIWPWSSKIHFIVVRQIKKIHVSDLKLTPAAVRWDLYSSREHWIQACISRIREAGRLICKWDPKNLADFINSAVLCWEHLK